MVEIQTLRACEALKQKILLTNCCGCKTLLYTKLPWLRKSHFLAECDFSVFVLYFQFVFHRTSYWKQQAPITLNAYIKEQHQSIRGVSELEHLVILVDLGLPEPQTFSSLSTQPA